jgi:hypothetical protein
MPGPALLGIPLAKWLIGTLAAGYLGKNIYTDIAGLRQQGRLGEKQLGLQELMATYENEAIKRANEENRRQTERYLGMAKESERQRSRETSKDRQMALIAALLQGLGGYRQQTAQTMVDLNRSAPPMALTTLMRGI